VPESRSGAWAYSYLGGVAFRGTAAALLDGTRIDGSTDDDEGRSLMWFDDLTARMTTLQRRAEGYVRSNVAWSVLYRTVSYLRSALWVIPIVSLLLVFAIVPVLRALDRWLVWRVSGLELSGATALCQTVITLTLSFLVFTFGSLLVAIQIAGGQLTPRIIATTLLRDNVVRYSVGLFVFALVFAVMALNRLGAIVPDLVALTVALLGIASMATFLFLIDYAARLLRPVSILARVGDEAVTVIREVYPRLTDDALDGAPAARAWTGQARRVVAHIGRAGIVMAVDVVSLVHDARLAGGVVELVPQVGDFVAADEPLFVLHGGATAIGDERLRAAVALGAERTMEQDPMFAFRILVDIALKALSPAINDPTTAVLALDQIHRLLRAVGRRQLRGESIEDDQGVPRLILRTPDWEDYVQTSCTEIRACGTNSIQIVRRMRAMLDNLVSTLPVHRHDALERERRHLTRVVAAFYADAEEHALASVGDSQGLGGATSRQPARP